MRTQQYQNIIIGFGKAGKTLAGFLGKRGEKTALIERSPLMYGGSCINVACIPTKTLITEAEKGTTFESAIERKKNINLKMREKNYNMLAQNDLIDVIDGTARFVAPHTIEVTQQDGTLTLNAERIFINTGAKPYMPNIKGINSKYVRNSESMLQESVPPQKLVIVGGGFIGLEFASMMSQFGSEVILLDHGQTFLPKEDRDIAQHIQTALEDNRLKIISAASVYEIEDQEKTALVRFKHNGKEETIETSLVMFATGRQPATDELNLEAAGIETNARGFIVVDDQLRTNVPQVWALGDVNGGPQFTYISLDDFRIIKNQLTGGDYDQRSLRKTFPTAVFLTPPYARIGINEQEAQAQGIDYQCFTLPTAAIPKSAIIGEQQGMLKALVDKKTQAILGVMLFCPEAHELINIVKIAMDGQLPYTYLRDAVYTHPTMAEAFNMLFG